MPGRSDQIYETNTFADRGSIIIFLHCRQTAVKCFAAIETKTQFLPLDVFAISVCPKTHTKTEPQKTERRSVAPETDSADASSSGQHVRLIMAVARIQRARLSSRQIVRAMWLLCLFCPIATGMRSVLLALLRVKAINAFPHFHWPMGRVSRISARHHHRGGGRRPLPAERRAARSGCFRKEIDNSRPFTAADARGP